MTSQGHPGQGSGSPVSALAPGAIKVVILAAGASTRLGEPKQLVRLQGETLLARTVRLAGALARSRDAVAASCTVVTGAHHGAVAAEAAAAGDAASVFNPGYAAGMASSLRCGVASADADPGCAAVLIMLCDQPLIPAEALCRLVDAFAAAPGRPAASARDGLVGVPAVFPRRLFPALMALSGDRGARAVLRAAQDEVTAVAVPEAAVDVDTPEVLARLRSGEHPGALPRKRREE